MSYIDRYPRLQLAWQSSMLSREFAYKVFNMGLNARHPKIEKLITGEFTKNEIMLEDQETNVPLLIYIIKHGQYKGQIVLAQVDGTLERFDFTKSCKSNKMMKANPRYTQITTFNIDMKEYGVCCANGDLHIIDFHEMCFVKETDNLSENAKSIFCNIGETC